MSGCPSVSLDDFYRDGDHPDLPQTLGIVDWDDIASWDADGAVATLSELLATGRAEVPVYSIAANARTGSRTVDLDDVGGPGRSRAPGCSGVIVAEGIFAPQMFERCRDAGLPVTAIWLDRPRTLSLVLRLVRDLREGRKRPGVLVRRGLALWRAEPGVRARALAAGCTPMSFRSALADLTGRPEPSD
ncbi:MAG: hypothetical protein L0G99_00385 [Propionibacteriales bacterium]|nr:hypothetical protein [Propionibacteriales bacterium]